MKIVKSVQPGSEAKFIVSEDGNSWYLINELLPDKRFHNSIQILEYHINNPNQLSTYISTGMSAKATEWLIDQWGWDVPFQYLVDEAKKTNNSDLFWEGHLIGQHKEYYQIEQLTNLDSLPNSGFTVIVLPLKIIGGSAAPARVGAVLDE